MFNYEKRFTRHKDSRNVHPDVRVNPMASSEEDAAKVPEGVVPQVCAELVFSAWDGFSEGVEFDLGHRAVRVPLPYAICIRVGDVDGEICPVSAKIELNPDQASSMLVSMICGYATFEKEVDNEGRSVYEDVILTFWGAPDTYAKECTANFIVTVTDVNGESYETTFCVTAHSVEPVVAVECPNTKSRVQRNDTHVTFTAGKTGEESITVWNETEGNAPLLLNVLLKDSAKGIFNVGRESDDSCVCFPITLPPASSFSFVVRFDLSYAQLKQSSYYGCVLIKLANMLPKKTRTWGDRDLHWTYDHVLALQVSPNDEDFSHDLPSEEIETPSEEFYDFEEFLRAEGEDGIEDIYPLDVDVAACDSEQPSDSLEEGPLYEGVFSMLEPVKWVLSEEIDDTTEEGGEELSLDREDCNVGYASPSEESEMKDALDHELEAAGDICSGLDVDWEDQPDTDKVQYVVREIAPDPESVEANLQSKVEDEFSLTHQYLPAKLSSEDRDTKSGEANMITFDRPRVVLSENCESEEEYVKSSQNGGNIGLEEDSPNQDESTPSCAHRERFVEKTPFGKLVGYGPRSDRFEARPLVSKTLEFNEARSSKRSVPLVPVLRPEVRSADLIEAEAGSSRENDGQCSSILSERKTTKPNGESIAVIERVEKTFGADTLSGQQVSERYAQGRRDTLNSAFAQFGSITSSRESVAGDNLFSPSNAHSSATPRDSDDGRSKSNLHTYETGLPFDANVNAIPSTGSCASTYGAGADDSLLKSMQGIIDSGNSEFSRDSTGAGIGRFKAQKQNAPKPPKIPNRQQPESFAFKDHRESLTAGRAKESLSSVSTFTSVRDSGMVVKTAQKFTLRSVFNKDMRPKLRMPRRIHQKGLYLLAHRGSVVLPISNASGVDIEIHAKVEAPVGSEARATANPSFLVVQPAQRSEIVLTRNSSFSGMLSTVLLCKSVRNERSLTAYRVPLTVEPLRKVVDNSGFKIDRPSLTYYNPSAESRINRVRVYNGTAQQATYQVWIGRGKIATASATESPFRVKKGVSGVALSTESIDVDVEFDAGEVVGHFYEDLNIMMDDQLEKMRLFGYSGGSEIRLEFTENNILRARNSGRRFGFIVITGPDEKSDDACGERMVMAPGEEQRYEMPFGSGSLIYTGDEIARVRFCMAVEREPALHGENEHMLRLFMGRFDGAQRASVQEGYNFRRDNRYTLHYASRLLETCTRQYRFDVQDERVSLCKGVASDLLETWRVVKEENGMMRIVNNDPREALGFTAEGIEPNGGRVPALGDARVVAFRERVCINARGTQVNLDVGQIGR